MARLAAGDVALPLIAVIALGVGLVLDARFGYPGQLAADALVVAAWIAMRRIATPAERIEQILCVVIATAGELFLCFGCGFYEYRHANIPVFVPFGHALVYLAGVRLARYAPRISASVVVPIATIAVATLAWRGDDRFGLVIFPLFLACLVPRRSRRFYAVMFVVTFVLEIAGTRLEAWRWTPVEPIFGLPLTNPPLAAGAFYCVLDLLVLGAALGLRAGFPRRRQSFST